MAAKTKKQKTTIDDLAIMVKKGFDEVNSKIDSVKTELKEFKEVNRLDHEEMKETNRLEHEEIKLRLDNGAHRFELVELQKRVQILEKRAGIMPQSR